MKLKSYKILILTLILGLNTLLFSNTYNGTDLLRELVWNTSSTSDTKVLYRGVLKNSEQYSLLQQAIDQWYLKNKSLLIKLKSEFTNTSLKTFASLYAGVRLPLSWDTPVDETTWQESISLIRAGYQSTVKSLPTTTEAIQQELIRLLERNKISDQKRISELMALLGTDPYANSYTGNDSQSFDNMLNGEVIGIGISVQKDYNNNTIIWHIYEWPAFSAWLQQGDILIRVDNLMIEQQTSLTDIGDAIQGKVGTKVILVVLRNDKVYEYTLTRKKISIDPIIIEQIKPDTILMTISMFQTNTYDSFLKKFPIINQSKNLIIDLRNNLWGSLSDTEQMLHHFIQKGLPLYHIQTNTTIETTYSKGKTPSLSQTNPLYIMTNHNTASASEIFAGVIHEYYPNSKIIGTTTYGKGTVQTVRSNSHETVKFTTGKRLLGKSKTSIDGIGLKPDIQLSDNIKTPQDEVLQYILNQL